MKLLYEKYKTKDRVYNKILRRYWNDIEGIDFDYEDALIVAVEFYPISVFKLLKMSYWKMIDTYECPTKDMHELDEFFEKHFIYASEDNLLKPFDCGYSIAGHGEFGVNLARYFNADTRNVPSGLFIQLSMSGEGDPGPWEYLYVSLHLY